MAESFAELSWPKDIVTYSERRAYLRGQEDALRKPPSIVGILATSQKALAHQPTLCTCTDPWNCTGRAGRASDGSHCREHLTPRLEEDGS